MKKSFFKAEFDKGLREEWTLPPKRQKESRVRLENEIADAVLRRRIGNRPQQREAAPLAVHRVLPRRERDVSSVAALALPHTEANQLQALERSAGEMQLRIRQLSRRVSLLIRHDLDSHLRLHSVRGRLDPGDRSTVALFELVERNRRAGAGAATRVHRSD
jgi:hypothetical protein